MAPRDGGREEEQPHHGNSEKEHRQYVGRRRCDRREQRDEQNRNAPTLDDGLRAEHACEIEQHQEDRQNKCHTNHDSQLEDEVKVRFGSDNRRIIRGGK